MTSLKSSAQRLAKAVVGVCRSGGWQPQHNHATTKGLTGFRTAQSSTGLFPVGCVFVRGPERAGARPGPLSLSGGNHMTSPNG